MMGKLKKLKIIIASSAVILAGTISLFALNRDTGRNSVDLYKPAFVSTVGLRQDMYIVTDIRHTHELSRLLSDETKQNEQDIQMLVEAFGKKLQMVSLLAPNDILISSIKEYYSPFVTPELLQNWLADPQGAPGRMVSSPWPDRIEITKVEKSGRNIYTVYGEIIEITSEELVHGGAAAKRPITLVVQKVNGCWLISSVTLGEYSTCGPVSYENTRYGFEFCLPETWKGYSIVEEHWEGMSGDTILASGPELLIRHPDWTAENPRQDIPIMIFTLEQWDDLQNEEFFVSAAPIGPTELGRNSQYVFALPPRYNFAFPTGYEEVEEILQGSPLRTTNPS